MTDMNGIEEGKELLAAFMRRLYRQRLTTTSGGNISIRCGENILLTPSGTDKGELQAADVGVVDLSGKPLDKSFRPSIESEIHLEIYRRYNNITAVVHAHPLAASAFAASRAVIKSSYHAEAQVIIGQVGYVGYYCPGSHELARQVAEKVAEHHCLLLRNHGALCVGGSILQAFDRLEVLETAARINLIMRGALAEEAVELDAAAITELAKFS